MRSFHIGHEKEFSKNDVIIKRSFTSCGGPQTSNTKGVSINFFIGSCRRRNRRLCHKQNSNARGPSQTKQAAVRGLAGSGRQLIPRLLLKHLSLMISFHNATRFSRRLLPVESRECKAGQRVS